MQSSPLHLAVPNLVTITLRRTRACSICQKLHISGQLADVSPPSCRPSAPPIAVTAPLSFRPLCSGFNMNRQVLQMLQRSSTPVALAPVTVLVPTQGTATSSGVEEINPGEVHRWRQWHYAWQCHKQAASKGIRTHSKLLVHTGFTARTNGTAGSQHSEFARRAARIGLGIHGTSQKLNKLAQLAKRTSMFDDPAAEINDLTGGFACCLSSSQHCTPARPYYAYYASPQGALCMCRGHQAGHTGHERGHRRLANSQQLGL